MNDGTTAGQVTGFIGNKPKCVGWAWNMRVKVRSCGEEADSEHTFFFVPLWNDLPVRIYLPDSGPCLAHPAVWLESRRQASFGLIEERDGGSRAERFLPLDTQPFVRAL